MNFWKRLLGTADQRPKAVPSTVSDVRDLPATTAASRDLLRILESLPVFTEEAVAAWKGDPYSGLPMISAPPSSAANVAESVSALLQRARPHSYFKREEVGSFCALVVCAYLDGEITKVIRFFRVGQDSFLERGTSYVP